MTVVSLQDVHKSFGALKVLDGVSFEVERGASMMFCCTVRWGNRL